MNFDMLMRVILPVIALCISALTLYSMKKKASEERVSLTESRFRDEIRMLQAQIALLQKSIEECKVERDALERERVILFERLMKERV